MFNVAVLAGEIFGHRQALTYQEAEDMTVMEYVKQSLKNIRMLWASRDINDRLAQNYVKIIEDEVIISLGSGGLELRAQLNGEHHHFDLCVDGDGTPQLVYDFVRHSAGNAVRDGEEFGCWYSVRPYSLLQTDMEIVWDEYGITGKSPADADDWQCVNGHHRFRNGICIVCDELHSQTKVRTEKDISQHKHVGYNYWHSVARVHKKDAIRR